MARSTVAVRFTGDVANLKAGLRDVDGQLKGAQSRIGGLSGKMKVGLATAGGAAVLFGKQSIDAFRESEEAQAQLAAAYEKFPQLANGNIAALQRLNEELAKKTKFDDDAIASGQAVLAQFGLTEDQMVKLTPRLLDYAQRTGKDLPAAAADLGKAVKGQGRGLKAVGVRFKDTGDEAANFEQIVTGLDGTVGGLAETAGGTTSGKLAILQNQFGELQEKVGAKLIPVLLKLADVGLSIVDFLSNLSPEMQVAIGVVAGLAGVLFIIVKAVQAWTAAQAALNVVMSLNPIVLVVAAVAAFIAILVVAYKRVGWFRDLVDGAFKLIQTVIMGAFNWVKDNWPLLLAILTGPIGLAVLAITRNWDTIKTGVTAVKDWIVGRFDDVVSFIGGLPGKISSAASGMWDGLKDAFKSALNWIIRGWNSLEFKIPGFNPPGPGPKFGGFTLGVPDLPQLAAGGIVKRQPGGIVANIGEGRYDEAVVPLRPGMGMGNTYHITVNASPVADLASVGKTVVEAISAYERRSGARWRAS